jgi:hypothetical protein
MILVVFGAITSRRKAPLLLCILRAKSGIFYTNLLKIVRSWGDAMRYGHLDLAVSNLTVGKSLY